jgi:hypothetical protein
MGLESLSVLKNTLKNGYRKSAESITFNQIVSVVVFAILIIIGALTTLVWPHGFIVALCAGALGGLAHEMVQSGGKFILPGTEDHNFCLGGLVGMVEGGVAGLLTYQGLLGTAGVTVSSKLVVTAIVAGFALKGIADAPNPSTTPTSTTTPTPTTTPAPTTTTSTSPTE